MKFLDYIKGLRTGKDAHRIEREAMGDLFLSDALEGFDSIEGNHLDRIERMQKQIRDKSRSGNAHLKTWSIAASILICISIGGYLLWNKENPSYTDTVAMVNEEMESAAAEDSAPVVADEKENLMKKTLPVETKSERQILDIHQQAEKQEMADIKMDLPLSAEETSAQMEIETESSQAVAVKDFKEFPTDSTGISTAAAFENTQSTDKVSAVAFGVSSKEQAPAAQTKSARKKIKSVPVIGMEAYQDYLKKNRIRPADKECAGKKGTVVLLFSVSANGKPIHIQVKTSVCPGMDAEAIRLLTEGCLWTISPDTVELKVEF